MRMSWLLCVLMGTLAWGQAPPPGSAPVGNQAAPPAPADTSASVPADAPVITVNGICPSQSTTAATKGAAVKPASATAKAAQTTTSSADCKTVITKAQFEKIVSALAPNPTPQQKKQLAGVLPRLIAMSTEAKKEGLDKTPQYEETLKFVRMQVLTNQLQRKLQEQASTISDADMEKYYKDNPGAFEQYNVDRIFVPRMKQADTEAKENDDNDSKLTDEQKKAKEDAEKAKTEANEEAMTKLADTLRARAAAGEDPVKLQKEAFEAAGMKIESPTVNLPSVRRSGLPAGQVAVLDLKPGEVSQVINDSGGHYIYKMISKTEMPFDQAKTEIRTKLQNDRMREAMEKLNNSFKVDTNEAYFGPASAGPMMPPRMPRPRPGMPPAGQPGAPQGATPAPQPPAPDKD